MSNNIYSIKYWILPIGMSYIFELLCIIFWCFFCIYESEQKEKEKEGVKKKRKKRIQNSKKNQERKGWEGGKNKSGNRTMWKLRWKNKLECQD